MAAAGSNRANKADVWGLVGVTGSGKTTAVMRDLKRSKPSRLLVWDAKGEFAREGYARPVSKISEVARALIEAKGRGRLALAFYPTGDPKKKKADFGDLCELAFHAKNLTLIAEELAAVTLPGWAPEGWELCTTQGRSEGLRVIGLTQSPAWVDKQFFGNCTRIRCGRIFMPAHLKTMADVLGVPRIDISAQGDGDYIELDVRTRAITRGNVFRK